MNVHSMKIMNLNSILNLSKARHLSQTSWSVYSCNTAQVFSTTSRNQKRIINECFKDPAYRLQSIKTDKKVCIKYTHTPIIHKWITLTDSMSKYINDFLILKLDIQEHVFYHWSKKL